MTSESVIGRPMEILLVEDSLAQARLAMAMLKQCHFKHRVTLVLDGLQALQFLNRDGIFARAPRPDLILLDLGLPKMDGRQLLREIKSNWELKNIPVVITTASDEHEDKVRSEMLQVESYMTKPVNVEKFVSVIRELKRFWHDDLILPSHG